MSVRFEWNTEKAKINFQKHQVDFEEASTVFDDPQFITFLDDEHSINETRFITIGLSNKQRLLLVAHTDRNENIRIISARKGTKDEENFYNSAG